MMRVFGIVMAAALTAGLAACSGEGDSRRIIAETCVRDGGAEGMCDCLARQSVKELEKPALEAVVLGAQGLDGEADRAMAAFSAEENARFRTDLQGIARTCEADAYLSQN